MKKIILLSGVIIVLFFVVFLFLQIKTQNANDGSLAKANATTTMNGRIYFLSYSDGAKQINYYDSSGKISTIFNDKDEDYKLEKFGNFAPMAGEFFAYLQSGEKGRIVAFKLGDKEDQRLIKADFAKPDSFAADPLGKTIYYSRQNIIDTNDKYSLTSETVDGKNKRIIYQSDLPILNLEVSNGGNKVIFTQDENRILSLNLDTLKTDEVFKSGEKIYDLSMKRDDSLVFTQSKDSNLNNGIVYLLNPQSGELKKVASSIENMPASAVLSSDSIFAAFVQKNFKDKFNEMLSGDLSIAKIGTDKIDKISSAIHVICWLP